MQTRPDGRDRGQVIIVAALVIAATFVGLALVLNSGIYAENLSSRETTDTEGALSFTLATDEAVAEAYERTNRNGSATAEQARTTFDGTMDAWEVAQQRRGANQGIGVGVERTAHVGWRLEQSTSVDFTDDDTNGNWTLATGATNVGRFDMTVDRDSLYNADTWDGVNSSFHINVTNGSNDWRLYIFEYGDDVVVYAGVPGTYDDFSSLSSSPKSCEQTGSSVLVDFENESLDDSACDALNFSDDLEGPVDVTYRNATRVTGTYRLAVNGSDSVLKSGDDPTHFDTPDGTSEPTATAIVYSASYGSHYGRTDLTHERNGTHMVRNETHAS